MTDETLKLMADRFDDLQKYLDDKFADNKSDLFFGIFVDYAYGQMLSQIAN